MAISTSEPSPISIAMELETAVRLKANLVHMVWIDGTCDMVGVQEEAARGRHRDASVVAALRSRRPLSGKPDVLWSTHNQHRLSCGSRRY
jgi:hypothetical protein